VESTVVINVILVVRPVRHGPQGPCSQGAPNMKAGIQYSYSLRTHKTCCPTFNAIYIPGLPTCFHQNKPDVVPKKARKSQTAVL